MRILHFIKGLGRGGAEMLLVNALRHADRQRFDYEYAHMLPYKDALVGELEAEGAPVFVIRGESKSELAMAPLRLARLVRERQVDLVHAHLPVAGMTARLAGALTRTPVVYTEHNLNERYGSLTRLGNRLTWPLNSACIAVSGPVAESIRYTMPLQGRVPVSTILNGIDTSRFGAADRRHETRGQLGLAPDALVVVTVAVFRTQKRLDLWLEAAQGIAALCPDARFLIVGDGPLRSDVERWTKSRGLGERVILTGLQEDVEPFLAAADLFLSTSDFEGLPLAMIEGMAVGLPVVATRAGGVPDLVGEGTEAGGIMVNTGDVRGCVTGAVRLLSDQALRRALGEVARARVRRGFSVERMVHEYEALYDSVLRVRR